MKIKVEWTETCTYKRIVEIDEDDWADANAEPGASIYVDELLTDAVIEQADYLKDIVSCEDREIDGYEVQL